MSSKKSKLDLLVRVRYSNPLPAPPCPPKLLDIPTDPMRYARPEFLTSIASSTPLPMIVDAELGMPLDLSHWESLWGENGEDSELNPDPTNLPELDPKDDFLLGDISSNAFSSHSFGGTVSGSHTPITNVPQVTWLRKTEYLSREINSRGSGPQESLSKINRPPDIDVSRSAQIRDIEASFAATENFDLSTLRHPNKPELTAVESYEIFPDADIWANAYDLFRFSERPGERPADVEDPRLDCAILRPMESDGDHFLAYYLTKDDETALEFKRSRATQSTDAAEEPTPFHFVRDYETVKVEQEVPSEFLIVLDDGDDVKFEDDEDEDRKPTRRRPKGAYYKNIERKMLLKKKRTNSYEADHEKWDVVKVRHVPMNKEEEEERDEALAEVMDPMYLLSRGDADAEGDADETLIGSGGHDGGGAQSTLDADAMDVFGEV